MGRAVHGKGAAVIASPIRRWRSRRRTLAAGAATGRAPSHNAKRQASAWAAGYASPTWRRSRWAAASGGMAGGEPWESTAAGESARSSRTNLSPNRQVRFANETVNVLGILLSLHASVLALLLG